MSAHLLRGVTVYDRGGPSDGEAVDLVLLPDGRARFGSAHAPADSAEHEASGWGVSLGWADVGSAVGEPGDEQRETLASLAEAGRRGGYTHLAVQPSLPAAADSRADVEALLARAAGLQVDISVVAAITEQRAGEALAELGDLTAAGVRHLSDGERGFADVKLLELALTYARPLGCTVHAQPLTPRLAGEAGVGESVVSTRLGLPGVPAIAEAIALERDLRVAEYAGGRLHVVAVTLADSLRRLRDWRPAASEVSFGVSVPHLALSDKDLLGFDVGAKVWPPLRRPHDREALVASLRAGEPAVLTALHRPVTPEERQVEFAYAEPGLATLEVAFGLACSGVGEVGTVVEYLGRRNRAFLGLPVPNIADGVACDLTVFAPEEAWTAPTAPRASLGGNPAVPGRRLRGRPVATFRGGELAFND